jgi:hypothetical protein
MGAHDEVDREATMSMKTILVPTENHDAMLSALETALLLARRCDSYIEGFALRWSINEFTGVDMMSGLPLERYKQDSEEEAKNARQLFESFMRIARASKLSGAGNPGSGHIRLLVLMIVRNVFPSELIGQNVQLMVPRNSCHRPILLNRANDSRTL